ncbi:hypothetical protein GGR54DRAFT_581248 [Hypoxylon sp. NC1633]|nr:hypothetical protein GGR54DRAFT_581248 [Hypoxylon sp. NC1633]
MNHNTTAYTPLEAFALFQELNRNFQNGLVIGTFSRISDTLRTTPLIYEQDTYDADRLSPESLQNFALQLLREERKEEKKRETEAAAVDKNSASLSPNSRKRKLQSPPLPTLQDALEQKDKLPILVEKLYARFRDGIVREIKEDERRYEELERELHEIERGEWDDRLGQEKRVDQGKNGIPAANITTPARPEVHVAPTPAPEPTTARVPVPVPEPALVPTVTTAPVSTAVPPPTTAAVPAQTTNPMPARTLTPILTLTPTPVSVPSKIHDPARRNEPSHAPQVSQEKKPTHPVSSPLPPVAITTSEVRHATPGNRPQEPDHPISLPTPVLQHPQAAQGYHVRPGSITPQPPVTDGLQSPDSVANGRSPPPTQSSQPQAHTPAPTPALAVAPPLKWEPPYQPPHSSPHQALQQIPKQPLHQPPPQPSQPPHQNSPQPSQPPQPVPPPQQHQPVHQTPVPSPRPPYNTGVARPPTYQPQASTGHPQFPPNYAGGRQTPGQYIQQPRPPPQGSTPASPPVLLPPQIAGQIPPSLQSLPLNATPDGAGQHVPQRRPAVIPPPSSPGPNIEHGSHTQPQSQHVPAQTPIRPPVALSAVQPAVSSAKPPLPAQWTQASHPSRPSHPVQATQTPQQTQPPASLSSYSSPYNPQTQPTGASDSGHRPHVPLLQTPIAVAPVPQSSRPPFVSQAQTPVAGSPHIIRGHGTRWTSTPTPATPRMENMSSYFDIESPDFEPISPPPQPALAPKSSSEHTGKKETRKPALKADGTPSRPRGRPRNPPKTTPLVQPEVLAEPDLPGSNIKNEEDTPRALEEIGDAAAVTESVPSQTQPAPSQQSNKRKRQDSPPDRASPTPATHVLWTRSFNKISQSALDQIISHRHANMFAHPVKPKTAPGYFEIVLRPQDLKGIQKAITAGSKAAAAAVATMPDVEANAANIWLPMSIDLVPPRGIVNIAQLERELVHMFANAIMYNPDPYRGFGPSFLRSNRRASVEGDEEDYRGYEVDENGVVKDTRSMFGEVEKLLGDLRNEVERNAPPPTGALLPASRSMSLAGGEANAAEEDADEQAGDGNKKRRIRG